MKDLQMIDMVHHCLCSSKGAFNEWRGSKLKIGIHNWTVESVVKNVQKMKKE